MAVCGGADCMVYCALFSVYFGVIFSDYSLAHTLVTESVPAAEFTRHTLIKPKTYHGREKRQISSSREKGGTHTHDLTIGYDVDGIDYILDLRLNRDLIPKGYFQRYQHGGKHVVNKPTGKDVELCQYQGTLRGRNGSWAAISTCHKGLSGVIFDGNELHYLEKVNSSDLDVGFNDVHFLYKHADLADTNKTCGFASSLVPNDNHHILENNEYNRILRYKRSSGDQSQVRGPYNANKRSRYVELVLVVDQQEYKSQGESIAKVNNRCKDIANIINALYAPLNIFVALVGVVIWSETDEIKLSENGDQTLTNFLHYRRERLVKEHPNDNAQLLTRVQFEGGVVGKALKGPICTFEFSGGVNMDHSSVVGLVATTVAHEMGHNFGMEHDTNDCKCPEDRCIMAPSSSSLSPKHWSSCSLEYLALAFEHGMDYCLRNKPLRLFDSPVCGNGFVEPGEQCDCGIEENCKNPCCNATTCMLHSNASCATGECCDFQTCRPKNAGSMCRSADHECDLPEYCTGQSEYCPNDVYKMDTETCDGGKAFCYQGSCRTRSDQCKLLWGPSGMSSDDQCYNMNDKGNRHGNCGYNRMNQSFVKCSAEDIFCGMLHCRHLNERLEFGMESVAILSHSFINAKGAIIPCRSAIVDLGLNQIDPGLTPDGAKCGDGKMCVNQKCMPVASLRRTAFRGGSCPGNCSGNGYCNSKGNCHCYDNYGPPDCDYPGVGGSTDSGPASDPSVRRDFVTALYIIFLGIIPLIALIALAIYYRHNVSFSWPKGSTKTSKTSPKTHRGNLAFQNAPQTIEISSRNEDNSTLLPQSDGQTPGTPASGINNNFFGHFKGFTITPIPKVNGTSKMITNSPFIKNDTAKPPQRVAPPVPTVPNVHIKSPKSVMRSNTTQGNKPILSVKPNITRSNTVRPNSITSAMSATNNISVAPALPPLNPGANPRPLISSPILENSTCTAKELISPLKNGTKIPIRPAPEVPLTTAAPISPVSKRPLSSPNSTTNTAITITQDDYKKPKTNGSALNRIASFLKNQKDDKPPAAASAESIARVHHAVKANKVLDKSTLKNIEISNPIPQTEIDIAITALPVDCVDLKDKNVVMRAQSMRGNAVTPRPAIPTFGSMRQPNHQKRPTSIPVANRPTSPPPPRPPQPELKPSQVTSKAKSSFFNKIPGLPGYQNPQAKAAPKPDTTDAESLYDDCLSSPPAPLANISEESSPSSGDNIYAVIEESPPAKKGYAISKDSSPSSGEYKSPKPLENRSNSGSSESMGLLGEIVNEIQCRNFDSIYSTSTLARKKKEAAMKQKSSSTSDDESEENPKGLPSKSDTLGSSDSSLGTYVNTSSIYKSPDSVYSNMNAQKSSASSTTSSGYLSPSAVNAPVTKPITKTAEVAKTPANTTMSTFKGPSEPPLSSAGKSTVDFASYKPFASTLHRNAGPFASTFKNTSPGVSKKAADVTEKEKPPPKTPSPTAAKPAAKTLNRQITPPNLKRQTTPPNLKRQTTPPSSNRQTTPPQLKGNNKPQIARSVPPKNLPKTGQKPATNNSPDVVSSCSANNAIVKSPDIVNNSSNSIKTNLVSNPSSVPKTLPSKPTISAPKLIKQTSLSPKPTLKSPTEKKSSTISKSNSDTKPSVTPKSIGLNKSVSDTKSMPTAVRQAANKQSNVASLQKKFETTKQSATARSAQTKPTAK